MTDNSTGKKEVKQMYVSKEEIDKNIETWAGEGKTIALHGTYTYTKTNIKEQESEGATSASGTTDSSSSSAAKVDPNEQGKFELDQVKDGIYISAKPIKSKAKDVSKEDKEAGEDDTHEK